ncbi:cupin domain-containing protein [Sphingorhabdus sp. EL138]|uniref:cupin domain-containing protein n=1 Tax=Sphingorhabdus sp. EL138 TaxID=2073156 RepID=UPI000D68A20F|nr:cupin domain-containing protein [Sphingorhabdus sp. EL138]
MAICAGKNSFIVPPDHGKSFWQPKPTGGYATVKLTPGITGFDRYSVGFQVFEPGVNVKRHAHNENHELIFVFEGNGQVTIEGESYPLEPGSLALVGPKTFHHLENTGTRQLKTMWVFSPPGLEHWFEAIGRQKNEGEPQPEPFDRPPGAYLSQNEIGIMRPEDHESPIRNSDSEPTSK